MAVLATPQEHRQSRRGMHDVIFTCCYEKKSTSKRKKKGARERVALKRVTHSSQTEKASDFGGN
ncbi:hypothetical protein OUZ56_025195 [Daphnia magna]|uniref:Uncharacterized protein n=1 Tax=Daphnia magna TaxID=35525 RepID=A0ABQ9ZJ49_9CRUS|nr:hypothetical protein OUZ56_025195 [Daphnia magna]